MSEESRPRRTRPSVDAPPSVLNTLAAKIGATPRVSLHGDLEDERGAGGADPVLDPSSPERQALPEGRGSYQVLGEIARGGMGVVLRGHDTDLGRDVAMKVLHEDLAGRADVVHRFVEEAQIGGQLQHPGIVPVYELGLMADERPYFTMKLVKGRTLATLLADREDVGADRRRLLDVFESMCQTVAYAHSRGVIHRDLKPANVMVGAFGEVQVVDWGLAKVLGRGGTADERRAREPDTTVLETVRSDGSGSGSASLVGSVLGTPDYMPPEQARGDVERLDERSDVFALGAVLCEILTGKPPYPGPREEVLGQAAQGELDDAYGRLDACGADAELVALAKRCLVAAPAARPRNASLVAEALNDHLSGVEARAQQARIEAAEAQVRAQAERRARRLTLLLAAAVTLLFLGGAGGWMWLKTKETRRLADVAERDRVLAGEIQGALNEARLEASAGSFDAARASLERARSVASAGALSASGARRAGGEGRQDAARLDALRAPIALVAAEIERDARNAERIAEIERNAGRLIEELESLRNPLDLETGEGPRGVEAQVYEAYPEIFARYGFDILGGEPSVIAAELRENALGFQLALMLDLWATSAEQRNLVDQARHLLAVAKGVDPDPERIRVRDLVAAGNAERLRTYSQRDLSGQPPETLELIAVSLRSFGDLEGAVEVAERGVEIHPDSPRLHRLVVDLLVDNPFPLSTPQARKRGRRALTHALAAVALEPENASYRFFLGVLYIQLSEPDQAFRSFWEARQRAPQAAWPRIASAMTLLQDDAFDPRLPELLETLEASVLEPVERYWVAKTRWRYLYETGRMEANAPLTRELMAMPQLNGEDIEILCHTLAEVGLLDEAQAIYEEGARRGLSSDNGFAWQLATADLSGVDDPALRARTHELAREYVQRAVEANMESAAIWNTFAWVMVRLEDYEQALEAVAVGRELRGGATDLSDWLCAAVCHAELGDEDEARRWFDRALPYVDGTIDRTVNDQEQVLVGEAARRLGVPSPVPDRRRR